MDARPLGAPSFPFLPCIAVAAVWPFTMGADAATRLRLQTEVRTKWSGETGAGERDSVMVRCPKGSKRTGGGFASPQGNVVNILYSAPYRKRAWVVRFQIPGGEETRELVRVYIVCMRVAR